MSTSPRTTERKRASVTKAASAKDAPRQPLSKRLPGMTDKMLNTYQRTANSIVADAEHPKHATATRAVPMIEAEIKRRADGLAALDVKASPHR